MGGANDRSESKTPKKAAWQSAELHLSYRNAQQFDAHQGMSS